MFTVSFKDLVNAFGSLDEVDWFHVFNICPPDEYEFREYRDYIFRFFSKWENRWDSILKNYSEDFRSEINKQFEKYVKES